MTLLLVDGNWLVSALWWANANAVPQRFARVIARIRDEKGAARVVVCWDDAASWRRDAFPGYKAGRKRKPPALASALAACQRTPFPEHRGPELGLEADDLIAGLVEGWLAELERAYPKWDGWHLLILATDKDLMQLVAPRVRLVNVKGEETGPLEVVARWGVPPERIRHLLSWMGDRVDGLPGVPGVGPKRAAERANAGEVGNAETYRLCRLGRPEASTDALGSRLDTAHDPGVGEGNHDTREGAR